MKVNKKVMRKTPPGGRSLAKRPFQNIQVDFTEMPKVKKYLLVIVDHLTHWVEAVPTSKAAADAVSKVLLEHIIPRHGIINEIDSDWGTHFTAKVLQQVIADVGITWKLHTPWHPQSSGRVERMNQTLKNALTTLVIETKMNLLRCLLLALLRIRRNPRTHIGLLPYDVILGLSPLTVSQALATLQEGESQTREYVKEITRALEALRRKAYLPQTTPLDFKIHFFTPGDWVLIKCWKDTPLAKRWEGPFQVLLTTELAVCTSERGWIHASRVKGPVAEPKDWTVEQEGEVKIRIKRK